jgi:FKBP-type peptidyl-prolyl cis-trans isomerase
MKCVQVSFVVVLGSVLFLPGCDISPLRPHQTETQDSSENSMNNRAKTASGLEYEIIKEGSGETPKVGEHVTVHYTGWLNSNGELGKKFDSSVDRGEPFVFPIARGYVIRGWDEGVITMKLGEKRRLYIPAHLGYGSRGAGDLIPPNAALIFDVELLKIN